jgi:hypothetical protein
MQQRWRRTYIHHGELSLKAEATVDAIALPLAAVPALHLESEAFWNWTEPQPNASRRRTADGPTFITALGDGSLVLGTLELKERMLVFEVNSQQRAERSDRAGSRATHWPAVDRDPYRRSMMASRSADKSTALSSGLSADKSGLCSMRPALYELARRERLVAWLKPLENGAC